MHCGWNTLRPPLGGTWAHRWPCTWAQTCESAPLHHCEGLCEPRHDHLCPRVLGENMENTRLLVTSPLWSPNFLHPLPHPSRAWPGSTQEGKGGGGLHPSGLDQGPYASCKYVIWAGVGRRGQGPTLKIKDHILFFHGANTKPCLSCLSPSVLPAQTLEYGS